MIWREYLKSNDLSTFPQDLLDKKIEVVDCLKVMDMMSFTIKELMDRKKWHTGEITEKGWYLIEVKGGYYEIVKNDEYGIQSRVSSGWIDFDSESIVAWQKIEGEKK